MNKPKHLIIEFMKILRPLNCFMTGLAILFTYFVLNSYSIRSYIDLIIGFFTGFFASGAAMLINDVIDLEVDRINKPWKPLPRGIFSVYSIRLLSLIFLLVAISINLIISLYLFLVAFIFSIIAYIYNYMRKYWWSHFLVSISTMAPFIYGLFLAGLPYSKTLFTMLFSMVVFLINTAREFIKSIGDIEGDLKLGYKTIATVYGVKNASRASLIFSIIGSVLAVSIGIFGLANLYYTIILGIAGSIYTYSAYRVYRDYSRDNVLKMKKLMIYMMLLALIGFLLSGLP